MITRVNNSVVGNAYAKNAALTTQKKESASVTVPQQKSTKLEDLQESINSGNYKVDLSALSKKMADELL